MIHKQMRTLAILSILLTSFLVSSAHVGKLEELTFVDHKTFYLYKDSKTTLRYSGLPADIDIVQAQLSTKPDGPRARIIGAQNKTIEGGSNGYVDFVVEILADVDGRPNRSSVQLHLKTFRKTATDAYDIISSITNYIRTKECPHQGSRVCSIVKVKCREDSQDCFNGLKEVHKEFENECLADKAGATIYSYGTCE
ncbi:MAG: hypothetical protein HOA17_09785 [Candidatus Melainabacteria bacterium]|jgi:hypothetical protein|nr:hypothetical protein [Candidatus Melainabacteria bacterium]